MNRLVLTTVVLLAFIFIGTGTFFVIDEGQQAIITQFGEPVSGTINKAGLYFKIPLIQKVIYFDKRILKWDGEPNEIPTSDKKYIWVDTTARWKIIDPLLFLQRMNNMNRATLTLNDLINGSVRDLVTKNDLAEIIRSSDWNESFRSTTEKTKVQEVVKVGRDRFSQLVMADVGKVTSGFGMELLDVFVKRINYTQQVREKVYSRMISERQRIASQKRSEGEAAKAEILGEMDRKLKEITSNAFRKAEIIRGAADAKAAAIYGKAYNVDPEFYAFLTTMDSYKRVMDKNTRLVLQSNSPLYSYLNKYQLLKR
jgi:membrane protease subunit HflC